MTLTELSLMNRDVQQKIDSCLYHLNPTMLDSFVAQVKEAKQAIDALSAELFTLKALEHGADVLTILMNDWSSASCRLNLYVSSLGYKMFGDKLNAALAN